MTLTEFLAWEERQELRYEFDGFQPSAMTGGTVAHDRITFRLQSSLDARLAGTACQPFGPNVKVIVAGRARYPDAFIVCGPVDLKAAVAKDHVIVLEVLSDGDTRIDLIDTNSEYRATPSIQRYVILQQASRAAVVFVRRREDWLSEIVARNGAALDLPEVAINVPLEEIYEGTVPADLTVG